jgi:RNA polymerase sigma-54 factor
MLKASLQLKLGQQLTMTPQLQQAIRLLQLPIMDLQSQIQEALESNIMLEAVDESGENASTETSPQETTPANEEETWSETPLSSPAEMPWPSGEPRFTQEFADRSSETLKEHLLWQLEMENVRPDEMAIGHSIIDSINDDGYLTDDLETLRQSLQPEVNITPKRVEAVLETIQRFDPAGVAARNLGECIDLQLSQLDASTPGLELARQIAADYLELVADHQYVALRRRLRTSEDHLQDALALVRSCHPRPGSAIHSGSAEYVIPDVFVRKVDGRWSVEVNSATMPSLRVNQTYAGLIGRNTSHAVLRTQLQEARWLVRSLEIRSETLLKVARCIVDRQQDFFERGEEAMRPMVLRDVAEAVDMHESTISRVTTNKYMHTHRGVLEFRYFFSSHVTGADGSERSSTAIRAKIRKMIAQEDSKKPLSDNKIAQTLLEDGINVARRTVAKYREAMNIPTSSERKRLSIK